MTSSNAPRRSTRRPAAPESAPDRVDEQFVKTSNRLLALVLAASSTLGPVAVATAKDKDQPDARTGAVSALTATSAGVAGWLDTRGEATWFWFEYGTTTRYGQATQGKWAYGGTGNATETLRGLTAGTAYHFRFRAWSNDGGHGYGADGVFTTAAAPAGPTTPAPTPPSPATGLPVPAPAPAMPGPAPAPAPEPVLGESIGVAPAAGTVKVKAPGAGGFITLAAGDAIPVGSVLDTRNGTVALTTAVGTTTQTATFRGAMFQVRQAPTGHGMTDIVLRGGNFAGCSATGRKASAAARKPVRSLWSSDKGGRFRTHGRHSVATVRGTSWVTTDTCAGTRTTVKEGAVSVRDLRRGKTVLVRAGHTYLARAPR
jgi:hypothetical protein